MAPYGQPKINSGFLSNKPGPEGRYPVNLYYVPETERGYPALRKVPGLIEKVSIGDLPITGLRVIDLRLFATCGRALYELNTAFEATTLATFSADIGEGKVWMEGDEDQVVVVGNRRGIHYSRNTGTVTPILTDAAPRSLTYQDRYFIAAHKQQFIISDAGDGSSWDIANEGLPLGNSDELLASIANNRILWNFGRESTEPFSNQGDQDFPFQRIQGAFLEVGISGSSACCKLDNSVFFVDNYGRICRTTGYNYQVVSPLEISAQIAGYYREDCIALPIYWKGHAWAVFCFPTQNKTWVYDAATETVFQWSSGLLGGRHTINCHAEWKGQHVVGLTDGTICVLDIDTYTEKGESIRWQRTTPTIRYEGRMIQYDQFALDMKTGVGLISGHGPDSQEPPQVMLEVSDDDGKTWGTELWRGMGRIGEYTARVVWNKLGTTDVRCFRVTGTDPVLAEIYGADLECRIGK